MWAIKKIQHRYTYYCINSKWVHIFKLLAPTNSSVHRSCSVCVSNFHPLLYRSSHFFFLHKNPPPPPFSYTEVAIKCITVVFHLQNKWHKNLFLNPLDCISLKQCHFMEMQERFQELSGFGKLSQSNPAWKRGLELLHDVVQIPLWKDPIFRIGN